MSVETKNRKHSKRRGVQLVTAATVALTMASIGGNVIANVNGEPHIVKADDGSYNSPFVGKYSNYFKTSNPDLNNATHLYFNDSTKVGVVNTDGKFIKIDRDDQGQLKHWTGSGKNSNPNTAYLEYPRVQVEASYDYDSYGYKSLKIQKLNDGHGNSLLGNAFIYENIGTAGGHQIDAVVQNLSFDSNVLQEKTLGTGIYTTFAQTSNSMRSVTGDADTGGSGSFSTSAITLFDHQTGKPFKGKINILQALGQAFQVSTSTSEKLNKEFTDSYNLKEEDGSDKYKIVKEFTFNDDTKKSITKTSSSKFNDGRNSENITQTRLNGTSTIVWNLGRFNFSATNNPNAINKDFLSGWQKGYNIKNSEVEAKAQSIYDAGKGQNLMSYTDFMRGTKGLVAAEMAGANGLKYGLFTDLYSTESNESTNESSAGQDFNPYLMNAFDLYVGAGEETLEAGKGRDDIDGAHDSDLNKTVKRTVNINDPHSGKKTTTQQVKFKRNATVDSETKKVKSYGDWQVDGKASFDKVAVPHVDGYTASRGDIDAKNVSASDKDETIDVNYTANDQSITYNFVDPSGKKVGSQTFKGKTDQTIDLKWDLPAHYHLAGDAPKSYKFKASGNNGSDIKVTSQEKALPGWNNGKYDKDLRKSVTRTVNITDPHTHKKSSTTQTVNFTRTAVYDATTDSLSNFGAWTADGKASFDKVDVPQVAGYTPSGQVPAATPKGDDKDSTIDITYTANDQQMNIVYQTKEGKEVGHHTIKGETDQTVQIDENDVKSNWVPDGYELVKGIQVPTSVTFKGAHADDIILKVVQVSKTELEDAIKKGQAVSASDKGKHASAEAQKALTDAIANGQNVDKNARATQEQVNSAKKAIEDAVKNVDDSAKAGLKGLIKDGKTDQGRDKYKNAPADQKKALDDAVANGQKVVDNPDATQQDIDNAGKAITDAMNNIDKTAKDGLNKSIAKGQADQKTTKYKAATDAEKKALDDAIANGQKVAADPNVDTDQIDAAKKAIDDAMTNIDKGAKAGLEDAIKKGEATQNTDKYKGDSDKTKKALDDALANGKKVAGDPDASKEDIDQAHQAIDNAIKNVDKEAKKGLEDSIKKGEAAQKSDKMSKATDSEKKALDDAIKNGHTVDNDPNASQKQIDDAKKAIDNAATAIDKTAKHDLDGAIDKGKKEQDGDKYHHASKDDQKGLDDAIKHAEDVNKNPDATQKEIDDAKKSIDDAIKKIDDDAKKGLNDAIKKGEDTQKTDKYQSAPDDLKKALDDAIANGKKVLADPNATQDDIDQAQKAIENAIKSIDANAKKDLEDSIKKAQEPQTQDKANTVSPDTKKNLDDALKKAQDVDINPDATKKEIDDAKKALDDATAKVDKEAKASLEDAIKKGEAAKDSQKYKDASDSERKALDDALAEAKKVDSDPDASAAAINNAAKKLNEASEKIDGLANKEDLKRAIANANDAKNTDKYKHATDAGKKALDDALAKAEKAVKDPDVSQKDVDQATADLNNAVNGLDQAHKSVTIDPTKPVKKGDKIPGTDIVSKGGLDENDLNHTVTRTINWTDPNGQKHTEKQTAKFSRTATIDLVTQKITYGAWSNNGKQVLPAFTPKVDGYTVTGSVPATTVTPNDKDITVANASFTFTKNSTGETTNTAGNEDKSNADTGTQTGNTQSGKTDSDKSNDKGGILPQTGHWVVKNAKAILIALGAGMAALGGWLFKRKRDEKKGSNK